VLFVDIALGALTPMMSFVIVDMNQIAETTQFCKISQTFSSTIGFPQVTICLTAMAAIEVKDNYITVCTRLSIRLTHIFLVLMPCPAVSQVIAVRVVPVRVKKLAALPIRQALFMVLLQEVIITVGLQMGMFANLGMAKFVKSTNQIFIATFHNSTPEPTVKWVQLHKKVMKVYVMTYAITI
jgi:hypothetical protein